MEGDHVVVVDDQLFGRRAGCGFQHVREGDAPLIFHQEGIVIAELLQDIALCIGDLDPVGKVIRRCAEFCLHSPQGSLEHYLEIERCQLL